MFMLYILGIIWQFMIIGYALPQMMSMQGAADKLVSLMNTPVTVKNEGTAFIEDANGRLELRDVKFKYPAKQDVLVLKGVSL